VWGTNFAKWTRASSHWESIKLTWLGLLSFTLCSSLKCHPGNVIWLFVVHAHNTLSLKGWRRAFQVSGEDISVWKSWNRSLNECKQEEVGVTSKGLGMLVKSLSNRFWCFSPVSVIKGNIRDLFETLWWGCFHQKDIPNWDNLMLSWSCRIHWLGISFLIRFRITRIVYVYDSKQVGTGGITCQDHQCFP